MSQMQAGLGSPPLGGPQRRTLDRQKLDFASISLGLSAFGIYRYGFRVNWANGTHLCSPQSGLHKGGCSSPSEDHRRELCADTWGRRGQKGQSSTRHCCLGCSLRKHCCWGDKVRILPLLCSRLSGKLPCPESSVSSTPGVLASELTPLTGVLSCRGKKCLHCL